MRGKIQDIGFTVNPVYGRGVKFFRRIWEKQSVIYWNNKQYMAVFFV